jgi:FAD:protein FMN transferase
LKKISLILIFLCLIILPQACRCIQKEHVFTGKTMGTTYHIKVVARFPVSTDGLDAEIEQTLDAINREMSTFIPTSEISLFNRSVDTEKKQAVSPDFFNVMTTAQKIYRLSEGAWDGTVKPLVALWGFGSAGPRQTLPEPRKIEALMKTVGFHRIEISEDGALRKTAPRVTLDLASIAKGYAVDRISTLIRSRSHEDFIVEVGGEVYAAGRRPDGKKWRVGVNTPRRDASFDMVYQAVELENTAMATSGDYRNFFELNGIRYSHIIDPRTGYPVKNGVVSVSVISGNCTLADGLATALMVLGPTAGVALADRMADTECLIIAQNSDDTFADYYSKGFPR